MFKRAPRYPSNVRGYVTIGYIEPRTDFLANWSPMVKLSTIVWVYRV